jgi:hypothetical protein
MNYGPYRVCIAKDRAGSVETLQVLRTPRRPPRRATLRQLHYAIVTAPDEVRGMTRMVLLRTPASIRPDPAGYRGELVATKLALKSLAKRVHELTDEIVDLDLMTSPWSKCWLRICSPSLASGPKVPASSS